MPEVVIIGADGKEHVFPDGFDPKKAAAIVRQQTAAPESKAEAPQGDLGRFAGYKMIGDAVTKNPVTAGAIAGGLAAAPFTGGMSIPGAMALAGTASAGGAGYGMAAKALKEGPSPSMADDVMGLLAQGVTGALGEGAGRLVSGALKLGGKHLYRGMLRPSIPLQREFGTDIAETGLKEGARVSQAGAQKIQGRLSQNADKAKAMIAEAEAAGASPITTKEVAGEFADVFQQGRRQAQLGRPDPRPAVHQRLADFDAKNPAGIPLGRAQELKSEAQDLASRAYRAADRGGPMTDLSAEADKAMARGLRGGIESRVPGIKDVNADSQKLIGVARALEDAEMRTQPGFGVLRALYGGQTPGITSGVAIAADRFGRKVPLNAAFMTALLAALGGAQE